MFSIILPSYLGLYAKSAKNRPDKLRRAIDSVLEQTFTDWELIVVADGCEETESIWHKYYSSNKQIRIFSVDRPKVVNKNMIRAGAVRNEGLKHAHGNWITYLDSDDILGKNHLQFINDEIYHLEKKRINFDWLIYNDYILNKYEKRFEERECPIKRGFCGTSNITHKGTLNVTWDNIAGYGLDDWQFIKKLMQYPHQRIEAPEYYVCHCPANNYEI